jgi:hypothetical protein
MARRMSAPNSRVMILRMRFILSPIRWLGDITSMPKGPQGQKRLEHDEDKARFEKKGKLAKAKPKAT